MAFAFFQIPLDASPELAAPLNAFLRTHRMVRVSTWASGWPPCPTAAATVDKSLFFSSPS